MIGTRLSRLARVAIGMALMCLPMAPLMAAEPASATATATASTDNPTIQEKVVRTCTACHHENYKIPVMSIFKTKHGVMADSRAPFGDRACMSCHGDSVEHLKDITKQPDVLFAEYSHNTPAEKNAPCLSCHENGIRMHWKGGQHETNNLACVDCHKIHTDHDKVRDKKTQPQVCFKCHKDRQADILKPYSHPIKEGKVACSDCHNPHGTVGPKLLKKNNVVETCYQCHAEKRGPFLWEHPPVREDCTNCHNPHGSIHQALLKQRVPFLCQQCHLMNQHPSGVYSGTGIPSGGGAAQQLLIRGCENCHSAVHGSNHPGGRRWQR